MIETEEDAIEYREKATRALTYLAELSADAGLNSYAAVFHSVCAAVRGGPGEFKILTDVVMEYNNSALERFANEPIP